MGRRPGSPHFPSRLPLAPAFQSRKVAPPTEGPGFTAKEKRQISGRKKKALAHRGSPLSRPRGTWVLPQEPFIVPVGTREGILRILGV